jgi:hypothetical protein
MDDESDIEMAWLGLKNDGKPDAPPPTLIQIAASGASAHDPKAFARGSRY